MAAREFAHNALTKELLELLRSIYQSLNTKKKLNVLQFLTRLEKAWKAACTQDPALELKYIKTYCVELLNNRPSTNPLLHLVRWMLKSSSFVGIDTAELTISSTLVMDCESFDQFLEDFKMPEVYSNLYQCVEAGMQDRDAAQVSILGNLDCDNLLDNLRSELWYRDQMNIYKESARGAVLEKIPDFDKLSAPVQHALRQNFGTPPHEVPQLYSHQAAALSALLAREHISLSTSTASGKSLVFITYGVDLLVKDPNGTVLAIYPSKALAQNQLLKWREFITKVGEAAKASGESSVGTIPCDVIDGDTDFKDRRTIIKDNRILLTNFDFVHKTMSLWKQMDFIRRLRFVAIDEAHVCRGIFGAHAALTLRRLLLLNRFLRAQYLRSAEESVKRARIDPANVLSACGVQLMTASATLGNPEEHFAHLTGQMCRSITIDGSPSAEKHLILWDPQKGQLSGGGPTSGPVAKRQQIPEEVSEASPAKQYTEGAQPERQSAIQDVVKLFVFFVKKNVRTFVFCNSRSLVELIFSEAQQKCSRIVNYRGGYAKASRRELERKMFCNEVMGVVTTNALELGIDLGLLDIVITLGFEGSVSSIRQRLGRAGRSDNRASIGFLVAFDSPVERYVCTVLKEKFWLRPPENVGVNVENLLLLKQHLLCALQEINTPIHQKVLRRIFGSAVDDAIAVALKTGEIRQVAVDQFYKFSVTSMHLLLCDGREVGQECLDIDELAERELVKENVKPERAESASDLSEPRRVGAVSPLVPEDFTLQDPEAIFPFLNRKDRVTSEGLTIEDLHRIVEQSEVKEQKDGLGQKSEADSKQCVSVQDLMGANDYESRTKFKDPHQLVDLRASAIPNMTVYIVSPIDLAGIAAPAFTGPERSGRRLAQVGRRIDDNQPDAMTADIVRGGTAVDEVELVNSFLTLFPGAVYPHRGVKYIVKEFAPTRLYAILEKPKTVINYYTKSGDSTRWALLSVSRTFRIARTPPSGEARQGQTTGHAFCGDIKVRVTVPHYYRVSQKSVKQLEKINLTIPDLSFVTRGIGFRFDGPSVWSVYMALLNQPSTAPSAYWAGLLQKSLTRSIKHLSRSYWPLFATHGLGHLLVKLVTTTVWCDVKEISCNCTGAYTVVHNDGFPKIFVYERASGLSLGIADALTQSNIEDLLQRCLELCETCGCAHTPDLDGCLDCVLLPTCAVQNQVVSHAATTLLLELILKNLKTRS